MTLSTSAKDFIASELGRNNCFASSGIAYTDPRGVAGTGSTYNVVKTMKLGGKGPHGEWFDEIPDYRQITDPDITWIGNNSYCVGDGGTIPGGTSGCTPGTTRCNRGNIETCNSAGTSWNVSTYCSDGCEIVNGVPTCKTGSGGGGGGGDSGTTNTGPLEVNIKSGTDCGTGAPTVRLDTSEAFAYFKATPVTYVGVMDIYVQNNSSDCYAYFAWEMRMWPGKPGTRCPTTSPARTEISRFLGEVQDTKTISTKMLGASENAMIGGSFEIPSHYEGVYTICLTLWGNFSKQALLDELANEGYPEDIAW
jgi:hypothetical protein